jgi:hypothetical protein
MGGRLGGLRRKAFLIGLGLGGLLELLFHWLEGGSEHGGGQLGNVPAISDSGFNPFLDQPLGAGRSEKPGGVHRIAAFLGGSAERPVLPRATL